MIQEQPGFRPFEHVTAPKSALYRAIMRVFVEHKRRFVVHLRPEDVVRDLSVAGGGTGESATRAEVENALDALAGWGNVRADPDTSRVASVEDFYRRRLLFQLTREGEAAERALATYEVEIGRRGELQSVALEDIRLRLRSLQGLLRDPDPDPAVVHNLLLELSGRLDSLAANASAFMGGLQRVIDLQDLDEEAFFAYKDRLIAYLERFVADLVQKSFDIRQTLLAIGAGSQGGEALDSLLLLAARREAGDAAPDGEGAPDPAQVRLDEWRARWSGLEAWFVGTRVQPSQSELLRRRASRAVPDLLAAIRLLQERRTGRSDRSADYRTLARWFAEADEHQAHRLWRIAFGLGPARHLTGLVGSPDGVADPAAASVPPGTSWLDAPSVEVAARLRQTGHYQRRGQPSRVVDRTEARAKLEAVLAAERDQAELARRRIATGRATRLADLGGPDGLLAGELWLFLRLLGDALAAGPGPDGVVHTVTSDGGYDVTLEPVPGGPVVPIRSSEGVIWAVDHVVTVIDRTAPPTAGEPPVAAAVTVTDAVTDAITDAITVAMADDGDSDRHGADAGGELSLRREEVRV
ncbi:MAG TPA: TIGR02677 family protein [Kineosporiaceae bacterium]|nr:TIGR02677 family protein [Kineosporiaceae bacterium]